MKKYHFRNSITTLMVINYHFAALLLLAAGIMKLADPAIGDILNELVDRKVLSLQEMVLVHRLHPWLEITIGCWALSGWQAQWSARLMAAIYIGFSALVYFIVEGYLQMPIACGCFGEAVGTPAYWTFYRNLLIAGMLLMFHAAHLRWTMWGYVAGWRRSSQ